MSSETLEERNKKIRERMLKLGDVRFGTFPKDSPWLRPVRMNFIQDGRAKVWDLLEARESVCIVIFNITRKKLVFVRQFRPASYVACLPKTSLTEIDLKKYPATLGLTIELCAGIVDKNKPLVEIAQDEVREECGYEAPISAFQKIITYRFVSASATKQTLFFVEVTDDMNTHPGGGLEEEGELIEIVEMSIDEVMTYISSEEVASPPCFLSGVSWFLRNKSSQYSK